MNRASRPFPVLPLALLAAGVAGVVLATAFAGWLQHGSSILLSAAERGLTWCF